MQQPRRKISTLLAMVLALSLVWENRGVQAVDYDEDFWEGFDAEEEPYEHDFTHIPDFINKTNVEWYFNLTHNVLLGIERGIYMNDSITLHPDCFGPKYVTKINEFSAMIKSDFLKHIILEASVVYQLIYMLNEQCTIEKTFSDLYVFCWNEGCYLDEMWNNTENNFLYMTRALIDAAIVWQEGIPTDEFVDQQQWYSLARQTGETIAEIIKEITNFNPQHTFNDDVFYDIKVIDGSPKAPEKEKLDSK
mmetsp:Transcript_17838/g.30268  ORF Transcript_17838/g.30268 Transcript_17838/m.30268 type:complete len:249 (-) Transcript_17838:977-1723(-)